MAAVFFLLFKEQLKEIEIQLGLKMDIPPLLVKYSRQLTNLIERTCEAIGS